MEIALFRVRKLEEALTPGDWVVGLCFALQSWEASAALGLQLLTSVSAVLHSCDAAGGNVPDTAPSFSKILETLEQVCQLAMHLARTSLLYWELTAARERSGYLFVVCKCSKSAGAQSL